MGCGKAGISVSRLSAGYITYGRNSYNKENLFD